MLLIFALLGCAAILFLIINGIIQYPKDRKKDREYKAYLDKSMEEDYFTDPETGRKFTLEEAEQGVDFSGYQEVRSDESIRQQFFKEEDRELAFIRNDLLKVGYSSLEGYDGAAPAFLYGESGVEGFHGIFEKEEGRMVLLVQVGINLFREVMYERKLVMAFKTKQQLGHILIWQTDMLSTLGGLLKNAHRKSPRGIYTACYYNAEQHQNHEIIDRVVGNAAAEVVECLLNQLDPYPGYECEIMEDYIYIKATKAASRDLLQDVLKHEKSLYESLAKYL